jgi:hypothetical protein
MATHEIVDASADLSPALGVDAQGFFTSDPTNVDASSIFDVEVIPPVGFVGLVLDANGSSGTGAVDYYVFKDEVLQVSVTDMGSYSGEIPNIWLPFRNKLILRVINFNAISGAPGVNINADVFFVRADVYESIVKSFYDIMQPLMTYYRAARSD